MRRRLGGACTESQFASKSSKRCESRVVFSTSPSQPTRHTTGCKLSPCEAAGGSPHEPDTNHLLWAPEHSDFIVKRLKLIIRHHRTLTTCVEGWEGLVEKVSSPPKVLRECESRVDFSTSLPNLRAEYRMQADAPRGRRRLSTQAQQRPPLMDPRAF